MHCVPPCVIFVMDEDNQKCNYSIVVYKLTITLYIRSFADIQACSITFAIYDSPSKLLTGASTWPEKQTLAPNVEINASVDHGDTLRTKIIRAG